METIAISRFRRYKSKDRPDRIGENAVILLVKRLGSSENTSSRPIGLQYPLLFRQVDAPKSQVALVYDDEALTVWGFGFGLGFWLGFGFAFSFGASFGSGLGLKLGFGFG